MERKSNKTVLPIARTISGVRHVLSYGVHSRAAHLPDDRCHDGRNDIIGRHTGSLLAGATDEQCVAGVVHGRFAARRVEHPCTLLLDQNSFICPETVLMNAHR